MRRARELPVERLRTRNRRQLEHRAHFRRFEDMSEIADQTIGDIDRGRRKAAQPYAESDPRRGPQKCVPTRAGFVGAKNNPAGVMRESKRRIAERAG